MCVCVCVCVLLSLFVLRVGCGMILLYQFLLIASLFTLLEIYRLRVALLLDNLLGGTKLETTGYINYLTQ